MSQSPTGSQGMTSSGCRDSQANARLRRYSRHLLVPEIGLAGQEKLDQARILCIGVGGLGTPIAAYLAAAGVGCLGIVDDDVVDISNLQRQILYSQSDIGRPKIEVAAEKIRAINPHVRVEAMRLRLDADNACELLSAYDLVIDGSDSFSTRYLVNDAAFLTKKANVFASIYRFAAQIILFSPEGRPCYRCLYPQPPVAEEVPSCSEGGVLGAIAGIAGSWQAAEALKYILQIGSSLEGRLLCLDALHSKHQEFSIQRDPECLLCGDTSYITTLQPERYEFIEEHIPDELEIDSRDVQSVLENGALFLDIREPHEAVLGLLPQSVHIPFSQLDARLSELDLQCTYIVACRVGARSAIAMRRLQDAGLQRLYHLKNGILSYIAHQDGLDAF